MKKVQITSWFIRDVASVVGAIMESLASAAREGSG